MYVEHNKFIVIKIKYETRIVKQFIARWVWVANGHPNPSSSPEYPNLNLMMASRGRNMLSYN